MEKEARRVQKVTRLKDENYLLKRKIPGALAKENAEIREMLENDKADIWDLLREE